MVRKSLMWLVGLLLLCGVVGLEARSKGEIVLEGVGDGQSVSVQKPSGKVVAVLVGINTYKDKRFRSLRYAEKDARDMKRYLLSVGVKSRDIKLLVGKQATLVRVKSAVGKWLRQRAGRGDAVFVFVSTHGEKLEGGNFLVMHDSDAADLEYSGLSGGFLENALKRMRVRQQMLVLDTCFSRAVASEYIASLGRKSNFLPNTHGTMFRGENRVVFTSSDGNEVSLEPRNLGNGLYTHYFLKGLRGEADKNGDKCITAQEIQDYVSDKVSDEARKLGATQTPSWRPDIAGKGMLLVRMPGCGQRVASTGTSTGGSSGTTPSGGGWGVLEVSANVGGVKVYVDGRYRAYLGKGQRKRLKLSSGKHTVVFQKSGYAEKKEEIELERDGELPLEGTLLKESATGSAEQPTSPIVVVPSEQPTPPRPTVASAQSTQGSTASAGDRKTFMAGEVEFAMRWIPAGTFMMGYDGSGNDNEKPQRRVQISKGFWMLETEVTQGQYKALVGSNPSYFKKCGDNCPVEKVSWHQARAFADKLSEAQGLTACTATGRGIFGCKGWRLPTEAEWEYAARAGTTTAFHTGDCISTDQANYDGNYPPSGCEKGEYREKTIEVCSLARNAWGLCDVHGNVWEWTMDWYEDSYRGLSTRDPLRSIGRSSRVMRGGSWGGNGGYVRSAGRGGSAPALRYDFVGFRLLRFP